MRFSVALTSLVAVASAANVRRADGDDTSACVEGIISALQSPPPIPTQYASVTEETCVPSSLTSAADSYIKAGSSWYASITSQISKCSAFSEDIPKLPDFSIPVCGQKGSDATATGTDAQATETGAGGASPSKTSGTDAPDNTGAGKTAGAEKTSKSSNAAAGARETGVAFAAALAGLAAVAL